MKKILSLMAFAVVFAFSLSYAVPSRAGNIETEKEQQGGGKNTSAVGTSYTIDGSFIAGAGSSMATPMTSKGLKLRTKNGAAVTGTAECVEFTVNEGYIINRLYIAALANYDKKDASLENCIFVTKVEVDGKETTFTGGNFPAKGASEAAELIVENIKATQNIRIYFDNSNAKGTQINAAWAITYRHPEDIVVEVPSGDISNAVATAVEGKDVKSLTINLTAGAQYTVSAPIETSANLTINGNGATIDASGLNDNMVKFAVVDAPTEWTEANVFINGVAVKGLKKALFYSAGKNYIGDFTLDNSVIEQAADATTFDYTKGSVAENFTITNSTIYAPTATTKQLYSSQGGQKATEAGNDIVQTLTFKNNTMYNLAKSKNFFSHRQSNQKWLAYTVQDNIFVNCGKSGQVIKGMNGGQSGANPTWTISGNVFNSDDADTSAAEDTGDADEPVKNSIAGVVTFTDAANGDFSGFFELSTGANTPASIPGDPHWTLIKQIYVIGDATAWNLTNMTPIEYNKETKAFELTIDVKGRTHFAISDIKAMANASDWDGDDGFNSAHRFAIAAGDNEATLDEETQLVKTNGTVVISGYGKYKVSITEDMKMTITLVERYPLYVIGTMNGWGQEKLPQMTFNEVSQTYDYLIKVEEGGYWFAVSDVDGFEDWGDFNTNHRYAIGDGDQTITIGEETNLIKSGVECTVFIEQPGSYAISISKDLSTIKVAAPVPVDIVVNAEAGDIAKAIEVAEENKVAKSLTLNLKADAAFTLSAPIAVPGDIIINGNGATVDVSNVGDALISLETLATSANAPALHRAPTDPANGYTYINEVSIKNITINGIKGSIFWDGNQKVCIENFAIEDAVLALTTESSSLKDNTIISFQGGCAKDFTIKNSTIYGNAVAKYFNKANNGADFVKGGYDEAKVTYENNTFYNLLKSDGQWGNNLRYNNNKDKIVATVNNNIWYDCGTGEILRRMFNTQFSNFKSGSTMTHNTFWTNGATVNQGSYGNDTDLPTDPEFADAANGDFHVGAGTAQAKEQTGDPRWLVAYDATKMPAKDIEIAANKITDGDITAAIAAAYNSEYQKVGSVTLKLNAGNYTISESITPTGSVKITGAGAGGDKGDNDATVIDASQLNAPFVQMSKAPTTAPNANGFYEIGNIVFENVKIKDLKQQLFYANKTKYLIPELKVNNSVILIDGGSKNIFDTNGGGVIAKLNVEETTIASPTAKHTGFLYTSQSGQKATEAGLEEQVLSFKNATIYQIANGKNTCNHRQSGQTWLKFNVENCLVVNSGKEGQFVLGLNGGQKSNNPTWTVTNSSFAWNGKDVAETEVGIAPDCAKATFTDIVYGMPFFRKDITAGIFTLGVCLQIGKQVGDPRWYNIPMITNLQNALARAAVLLDGAQEDWASAPAINEAVENLAAAYNDNKPYLESNYQEAIDEATARVEAAIAEFNKSMGDVTAIESVNSKTIDNGAWYTINGQRVDKPTQKGLYIHNGRKVVIK